MTKPPVYSDLKSDWAFASRSWLASNADSGNFGLTRNALRHFPRNSQPDAIQSIGLDTLFGLLLVLTMQTVYMKLANRYVGIALLILLTIVGLSLVVKRMPQLSRSTVTLIVFWTLLFVIIPVSHLAFLPEANVNKGATLEIAAMFVVVFPICLAYASLNGARLLLRSISNAVVLVTALTLPLYFLGQVFHVLQPTNAVEITWGGLHSVSSYFGLLFTPQGHTSYHGFANGRFTGIFVEAPMCAFMLCFVLIFMLFVDDKKPSLPRLLLVVIALYCTVSTTGYVVGLAMLFLYVVTKLWDVEKGHVLAAPTVLLVLMGIMLIIVMVNGRELLALDTGSAAVRSGNFQNALADFSQSLLIGIGFKADAIGVTRGNTSLYSQVLQQGGLLFALWYFLPFAIGLLSLCRARRWKLLTASLLYLLLLYPTVVTYTPISIAMVAVFCVIPHQLCIGYKDRFRRSVSTGASALASAPSLDHSGTNWLA